jgi:hypothetical protein
VLRFHETPDLSIKGSTSMGDAIQTPFDVFMFFLVFVGIPTLIFGGPIAVLGFLSARRSMRLNRKRRNESTDLLQAAPDSQEHLVSTLPGSPWLVALFLLVIVAAIVFLVFGASVSQMLMLD